MIETNAFKDRQRSAGQHLLALHRPEGRVDRRRAQSRSRANHEEDAGGDIYVTWNRTAVGYSFAARSGSARAGPGRRKRTGTNQGSK
jgi:hypothetical protein